MGARTHPCPPLGMHAPNEFPNFRVAPRVLTVDRGWDVAAFPRGHPVSDGQWC